MSVRIWDSPNPNPNLRLWGHNGVDMETNKINIYNKDFDWVMMKDRIQKNKEIPKTIYIKTDYLSKYKNELIKYDDYVLFVACSDDSAQDNKDFNEILEHCKHAYIENKKIPHPKVSALSVGLATHTPEMESMIGAVEPCYHKKHRIFCRWRARESPQRLTAIHFAAFDSRCDMYNDEMDYETFLNTLNKYKFALCPVGFGEDPAPRIIEVLSVGTIPIVLRTLCTVELYSKFPIIIVDNWKDIDIKSYCTGDFNLYRHFEITQYLKSLLLPYLAVV